MFDGLVRAAHQFVLQVGRFDESEILDQLHAVARLVELNVLGAWHVPSWARRGERQAYAVYRHSSMPAAFWPEYWELHQKHGCSFLAMKAWQNRGAFTLTEALRERKPSGDERWIVQLLYRHGARDVYYVPCGSWMVVYWSPKALLRLDAPSRAALQTAACAAAERLGRVIRREPKRVPEPELSAQQRAILRLRARGYSLQQAADHLQIRYGTAQEHQQRAIKKLRAKDLPHAVAEALHRYVVIGMSVSMACGAIFEAYDICCWDDIIRWSL